eukprot:CAMPEP_0116016896 /NCGR_PEP_ID=MMETSP0321-20121206/7739_1 /TAXON_ID=163516 /ORGANISM="Leptocylindrus danicus var. danicus, Strain B650" /LENGTH=897 /DNA_ID=CAMNT_0003487013 /DNA_START=619 /DNA_END=3309 /DNA_ORIENTATION=-
MGHPVNDEFELKRGNESSSPRVDTKHCSFALYVDDEASTPDGSDTNSVRKRQDLIEEDEDVAIKSRTVYIDQGLMSPEQLMQANGGRRRTLERLMTGQLVKVESERNVDRYKENSRWLLDKARISISYDDFMLAVTVFSLFGDDMRMLFFSPSSDAGFLVLFGSAFVLFVIEIILNCWVKTDYSRGLMQVKGYLFSFFFWLDLLALISMIPDVGRIWNGPIAAQLHQRSGRAGKIGAKAARVVRMVRLVRLVKLYKITSQRKREKQLLEDLQYVLDSGDDGIDRDELQEYLKRDQTRQSKVGAQLSDIITRRVIIAVLLMLCVVPLLSFTGNGHDENNSAEFLQAINVESGYGIDADCDYLISATNSYMNFMEDLEGDMKEEFLIGYQVTPTRCSSEVELDFMNTELMKKLRDEFIETVHSPLAIIDGQEFQVTLTFNLTSFIEEGCKERIYLTIFVIFMLLTLSMQFTNDAEKLVLGPIDIMMDMVNTVAHDPLSEYEYDTLPSSQYETMQVQVAIQKITTLLRVGFGIAGAEIISTNMCVEGGRSTSVLDPMIPGKRVYAIFGFCDIHNFDHCTGKLEDEIMTFVNKVAEIVHEEVTRWGGLCNKNLGNAFLMVWRIGDEKHLNQFHSKRRRRSNKQFKSLTAYSEYKPESVDLRRIPGLDVLSDKALIGFLKVIVALNRDPQILSYRRDERLALDGEPFKLRMGFGLHAGWAIEGAVGSLQKVDATYLSPHVNMAARMEAASRQFGVSVLMTQNFYELMSARAQASCRKLDVVTVKGSAIPMPIYSTDVLQNQYFPSLHTPKGIELDLSTVLEQRANDYSPTLWDEDEDLIQLRKLADQMFMTEFNKGIEAYLSGDWRTARVHLDKADDLMAGSDFGGDGPSKTILDYMKSKDW